MYQEELLPTSEGGQGDVAAPGHIDRLHRAKEVIKQTLQAYTAEGCLGAEQLDDIFATGGKSLSHLYLLYRVEQNSSVLPNGGASFNATFREKKGEHFLRCSGGKTLSGWWWPFCDMCHKRL